MMRRLPAVVLFLVASLGCEHAAQADTPHYLDHSKRGQVRSATLLLHPDGAFGRLDGAEWCAELERFLRERGVRSARQRHRRMFSDVAVNVATGDPQTSASETLRILGDAPVPLSRFSARLEVRTFANALFVSTFSRERWSRRQTVGPDLIPFTRDLAPGRWMMSVAPGAKRTTRLSVWDQVGEANPFEVQALVALPDGSLHRSRVVPWFPAGVAVSLPGDFPTLRGRRLEAGSYRVIFEADGKTIDWPRSLRFEHWN